MFVVEHKIVHVLSFIFILSVLGNAELSNNIHGVLFRTESAPSSSHGGHASFGISVIHKRLHDTATSRAPKRAALT
jgi:hypothetical protein